MGDYFNYIKVSERFYDRQIALIAKADPQTGDLYSDAYRQSKYAGQARGYESIGDWEKALEAWTLAERHSVAYLKKLKDTYPNYPNYYFPLLAAYEAKRGTLEDYEKVVNDLDAYYKNFEGMKYASLSSPEMSYNKAMQYAFYKDQRYPSLFELYLNSNNNKNFTLATMPEAGYAYFLMRDKQYKQS